MAQLAALSAKSGSRSKAPVFVLGCGRSGTTLLYHMLLSAGNFAVYRTESNVINLLEPRFGDLSQRANQERLIAAWLNSKLGRRSGLDAEMVRMHVFAECRNGGDFLRIVMEEMARQQGVERWADCTPEHLLFLPRIKETISNALIVHIIRDGRDVALSIDKLGYIRRLPWDRKPSVMVAGLYWEWIVRKGRGYGQELGHDYTEVHFEELVTNPQATLARLSDFIEHDLDYERIQRAGIGSVSEPNSSFRDSPDGQKFNPVGRWKKSFTKTDLAMFEELVGGTLQELGYKLATRNQAASSRIDLRCMRAAYHRYFDMKLLLKKNRRLSPVFVTRDLSWI